MGNQGVYEDTRYGSQDEERNEEKKGLSEGNIMVPLRTPEARTYPHYHRTPQCTYSRRVSDTTERALSVRLYVCKDTGRKSSSKSRLFLLPFPRDKNSNTGHIPHPTRVVRRKHSHLHPCQDQHC